VTARPPLTLDQLSQLIVDHEIQIGAYFLRCRCGWQVVRSSDARRLHSEHLAAKITSAPSASSASSASSVANVHDLTYAATALEGSADNGDRYCAQRLRNLAAAVTALSLKEARPNP
jgi:hypothetical protein